MGVMAYIGQVSISPDDFMALPESQRYILENRPAWATSAFAMAVFAGALGTLLLVLKKALAVPILYLSFLCILVQTYYGFFVVDSIELFGAQVVLMPSSVIIIGILLIALGRRAKSNGWIS